MERYARRHRLSRQELRLLITSINGVPDKRVAHEWGCSRSTIGTYWKRIFAKTGMRPQRNVLADLLRFAAEPTLTPPLEK